MAEDFDVVVVGGGHNGLVAAYYLSQAKLRVLVLERRPLVGGPAAAVEYFPGYKAAITNSPGSLEPKIVRDMRLEEHGLKFVHPDPTLFIPFPERRCFIAWRQKERVVEELGKFSRKDAAAYYELFDSLNELARKLRVSLFEPPPPLAEIAARLESQEDKDFFSRVMVGTIRDLLNERFESEEIKSVIATLAIMSNMAGASTPGTPLMLLMRPLSLASVSAGAGYDPRVQPMRGSTGLPLGGMGSIPRAMARSLQASGVMIRCDSEVVEIVTTANKVTGVVTKSGRHYRAPLVVSNLNPKTTLLKLLDSAALPPDVRKQVDELSMHGNAFKMGLALDRIPHFAAARTSDEVRQYAQCQFRIAPSMDYLDRAYEDARNGRPSRQAIFWGLTPSVTDPSLAPEGKHVMSVNIYHAPYRLSGTDWATEKNRFGNACIDTLNEYLPGLKDSIIHHRFWSPVDFEQEYGLLEANITHGDMTPGRMFSLRPFSGWSGYRMPVDGLYLCGVGTWPGGFVSGLPGHNAAHRILRDLEAGTTSSSEPVHMVGT